MDPNMSEHLVAANAERTLRSLTTNQHLNPHRNIAETLAQVCRELGLPQRLVDRAIQAVGLDEARAVGRLSRGQVCELARRLQLEWQKEITDRVRFAQVA